MREVERSLCSAPRDFRTRQERDQADDFPGPLSTDRRIRRSRGLRTHHRMSVRCVVIPVRVSAERSTCYSEFDFGRRSIGGAKRTKGYCTRLSDQLALPGTGRQRGFGADLTGSLGSYAIIRPCKPGDSQLFFQCFSALASPLVTRRPMASACQFGDILADRTKLNQTDVVLRGRLDFGKATDYLSDESKCKEKAGEPCALNLISTYSAASPETDISPWSAAERYNGCSQILACLILPVNPYLWRA